MSNPVAPLSRLILVLGLSVLVSACQLSGGKAAGPDDVTPNSVTGDAIEVTALDSPPPAAAPPAGTEAAGTEAAQVQADPTPAPADPTPQATDPAPQPDLAAEVPEPPKSEQQIACERKKGRWSATGKGNLRVCVFSTKDAGKQCTRESQCDGVCLARSGTCSPLKPLLGCNEILQDNGRRVTLCIE